MFLLLVNYYVVKHSLFIFGLLWIVFHTVFSLCLFISFPPRLFTFFMVITIISNVSSFYIVWINFLWFRIYFQFLLQCLDVAIIRLSSIALKHERSSWSSQPFSWPFLLKPVFSSFFSILYRVWHSLHPWYLKMARPHLLQIALHWR